MNDLNTAIEHLEARIVDLKEQGLTDTATLQKLTWAEEKLTALKTAMDGENYKVAYGQLVSINEHLDDIKEFRLH